jgi:hypothetical protein
VFEGQNHFGAMAVITLPIVPTQTPAQMEETA